MLFQLVIGIIVYGADDRDVYPAQTIILTMMPSPALQHCASHGGLWASSKA
jgi:hypothetical protein